MNTVDSWEHLSVLATTLSGFANIALLLAAISVAYIYFRQLKSMNRQTEASLVMPMLQSYSSQEMYDALYAVWNEPPTNFTIINGDTSKHVQGRRVKLFWQTLALLIEQKVIDETLVFKMLPDQIKVWERLRAIEEVFELSLVNRDMPELSEADKQRVVRKHMDESPIERLYQHWKKWPES